MDLDAEPSNKQVLNLMKQIVVQLQDQHMDMWNLLDQSCLPSTSRLRPRPTRCFFCHKFDKCMLKGQYIAQKC